MHLTSKKTEVKTPASIVTPVGILVGQVRSFLSDRVVRLEGMAIYWVHNLYDAIRRMYVLILGIFLTSS